MAARSTKSATSGAKWAFCPGPTARRIFTRGETQALVTATLGTKDDEQRIEMFDPAETIEALHAALQLPAVQRRRSRLHARPRTPRNRPRSIGRTRARCR